MKLLVIGCGNIGNKRIISLLNDPDAEVAALVEKDNERQKYLKNNYEYLVTDDYLSFLPGKNIEVCIVSTPPEASYKIILDCLRAGKHVLCEKPLGRNYYEAKEITDLANEHNLILKCGFNLRHDDGLMTAFNLYNTGEIGKAYFVKCTYVNGTVKVNSNKVGSLKDMGVHILDLMRWFMGEINIESASLGRYEYSLQNLDDNGFCIVKSNETVGQLHFSFVRWCNQFSFEITGEKGTIEVLNLPKWGEQKVVLHRRKYPAGIPDFETRIFSNDNSWINEWIEFKKCLRCLDMKWNNDGLKSMQLAETIENYSVKK